MKTEADRLVQRKSAENQRCFRCKTTELVCGHHLIHKSQSSSLRYNLDNLLPLCRGCHFWWHNYENIAIGEFVQKQPDRWNKLLKEKEKLVKVDRYYYEEAIDRLKQIN